MLYTATTYRKAIANLSFVFPNETLEQRDERIVAYMAKATADIDMLEVELMLEESDNNVLTLLRKLQDAFISYVQTHGSLKFQAVFENCPLKLPIFEHLDNHWSSLWQRSLILISSMITKWE